jgi:precorrin-2 dehydrogenase / sirohydrochlorin ferrochelatase
MLPIQLDVATLPIALIGAGPRAERRLKLLREAGAQRIACIPADSDLAGYRIVYIADFDEAASREIAARARAAGALVNVEDMADLCDFHTPAVVRRGDLTVTVATAGRAPGLAGVLAAYLGKLLGAVWTIRLELLEAKRRTWRRQGMGHRDIREMIAREIDHAGWLPPLAGPDFPENAKASDLSHSANSETLRKASFASGKTSQ